MGVSVLEHWWPVTYDYGLIRADLATVVAARQDMYERSGVQMTSRDVAGGLESCLQRLEPLSPAPTRELFLSTSFGWTAFLQNGYRGSDPFLPMSQLSRALGTMAVRACVAPQGASYPSVILEVFDTEASGADQTGRRRSIAAAKEDSGWVFEHSGAPFPFEEVTRFDARRKQDRFTPDMLHDYLRGLGAHPLTDSTLLREGQCRGGLLHRPRHEHLPSYTLNQAKQIGR